MRLCSGVGCGRAVADDIRFCDACKLPPVVIVAGDRIAQHANGYTAELDALRKSTRWQSLRTLVLRSHPLCQRCRLARSVICDHIVPAEIAVMQAQLSGKYMSRWEGYFIRSNLQGLCRACHYTKTVNDKTHVGPWPDVVEQAAQQTKRVFSF